jgi:tetratricopeptide (TPR) repeat protein
MSILATVLLLAFQDNDHLLIDEVSESFLKQWTIAEEAKNYKDLLEYYAGAQDPTHSRLGKLARPDPEVDRWLPVGRVLAAKLASLPASALEAHEVIAKQVLETVQEPHERRRTVERYAYTRAGREALDQMSNVDCDQGRLTEAIRGWTRAFEVRPSVETVARLAFAHATRSDGVSLANLRAQAEARGIKGELRVEGRKRELFEYIDSLHPAVRGASLPLPAAPLLKPAPAPDSEVPLGHYDLKEDGRYGERLAVSLPAAGRAKDRDLVVISNGLRIIALDPTRAEGGTIDDAVEWRWPKNEPTRKWTLGTYNSTSLPYVGPAVADGRVFCPMFRERQEAKQQVGRRQQRFLGPSVLQAVDLSTGEALWDTDSVMVDVRGEKKPLVEALDLDKSDYCFGGPPVVRGDRVFAAIMTSPFTGRQCWVLCLDVRSGQPLWCTDVGTAPQTKEMSVALLSEEDGTVVLSTNYGVIAALDSATGNFEWLVKYMGTRPKRDAQRAAASPPVIAGGLVYVLAQDCDELLAFDRWTGQESPLPKSFQAVAWKDVVHFLGRAGEWLVFSGPHNLALRPLDEQVVLLPESESGRFGRGAITEDRVYLPTRGELSIYDTRTWRLLATLKWPEATSPGNALIAGPLFIHMSDRLDLYTSEELLRDRFGLADGKGPVRPQSSRQLARILESAGRLKESVAYYRRALKTWERDPDWQETSDTLKKKLADLQEKLGDDFPKE